MKKFLSDNSNLKVLKQYADFSGRARRKEYWMFVLFNIIFSSVAIFMDNILGAIIIEEKIGGFGFFGYLYVLYTLIIFIPRLAVTVRRLHDVGKSGWMYLISLIPFIGAIWLLVLLVTDGNSGKNEYGENLKEMTIN